MMRSHFSFEPGVCYLDAASITPRPVAGVSAGQVALDASARPWHRREHKAALIEAVRALAAEAIGANESHIALVNSVSYGMATAAANVPVRAGRQILLLEDDHPSSSLIWNHTAAASQAAVRVVPRPRSGDWTSAVLTAIENGPMIDVAVLPPVHWADGCTLDLERIAPVVRSRGIALIVDATQAVGVIELNAPQLDVDFMMFPAYKWLLGPYGLAFLYAHPRHHEGVTLEQHMGTRKSPALRRGGSMGDFSHIEGAVRFDRGERDDEVLMAVAAEGMRLALHQAPAEKQALLWTLNDQLVSSLAGTPYKTFDRAHRSPHILSIETGAIDVVNLAAELERLSVFVSPRRGFLRVAPYVYNTPEDVEAFVVALRSAASSRC
ncbi:MAG: aminotransferase class V-fold PLP-dependent enzyme [Hydrogenophaga sp.]|uniref:aminotransferase class V-fold PLP-dependent enzyme n=1 Tax=Hydrogenophaga sp. TaxID=1904254 RepID=UPI0026250B16|nr:aminotransferase class V-fold PLP-dependent enzyme [Hydrogenophaga sp.]MCV0437459.1 aminotransferase class V-fold PLP-dependent enzyme [Hydrogenophaga sp.]